MLLKQLEYFISVVDHNSFTGAAYEHYISQSAISQQIKALETSLGVQLMVREKRSFHLTPAGEYLYRKGKQGLLHMKEIQHETIRIGNDSRPSLRIGYLNRYSGIAMQQTLIRMTKRYRNIEVRMYGGSHEELFTMLGERHVDIIFNDQWQSTQHTFIGTPVGTATTVAEVPQGYTTEGYIELKELTDLPLILVCSDDCRHVEESHYRKFMSYAGSFTYARTLEEARFLVAGNQGVLLIDRFKYLVDSLPGIERKRVLNHDKPIEQEYYFYTHEHNGNTYADAFKDLFVQVLDEF